MQSESARMASAAEARFRIDAPNSKPRAIKIIALDRPSDAVVKRLAQATWNHASFFTASAFAGAPQPPGSFSMRGWLSDVAGRTKDLMDEVGTADLVVMVATAGENAAAAAIIGEAGVIAGIAGTGLIVGAGARAMLPMELWAQLAIVAATICYAGAAIFGKTFKGLDPLLPAAGSMLCGAVILIPASLILEQPWTLTPSAHSTLALLGLSVFSTALAFTIYFRLLHTLGSVGTVSQAYLRVPIGVALGVVLLGESLSPSALGGLLCVIAGVAAMTLPRRAKVVSP